MQCQTVQATSRLFNIHLPGASALAAIGGLAAALQVAIEAAISPERIEINGKTQRARLETLTKQLLHEAKSIPTEGPSSADEARGMEAVIGIIGEITTRIRGEI